jgi:hypothetical protein
MTIATDKQQVDDMHVTTNAVLSIIAELEGFASDLAKRKSRVDNYLAQVQSDSLSVVGDDLKTEVLSRINILDAATSAMNALSDI